MIVLTFTVGVIQTFKSDDHKFAVKYKKRKKNGEASSIQRVEKVKIPSLKALTND